MEVKLLVSQLINIPTSILGKEIIYLIKIFFLQYSQIEKTNKIENIKHPIIKNTLKYFKFDKPCSIF